MNFYIVNYRRCVAGYLIIFGDTSSVCPFFFRFVLFLNPLHVGLGLYGCSTDTSCPRMSYSEPNAHTDPTSAASPSVVFRTLLCMETSV